MAEGIRKVNEYITASGRTLIITDANIQPATVPDGTLFIDPANGTFKIKLIGGDTWVNTTVANLIQQKSITGAYIADRTITNSKIALNGILSENILDGEITAAKIAGLAITDAKIANNAVTNAKILDGSVTVNKIADAAVGTAKLMDLAITNAKLASDAVSTIKILNGAVTESKILDDSISTGKIKDGNITQSKIANLAVGTTKIADSAITVVKIADGNVTAIKIADGNVVNSKLGDWCVTNNKIYDGAVTEYKISDSSISTNKLRDLAIINTKIANATINFGKFDSATQAYINSAIRVDPNNGNTATVGGNLSVSGNINATGDIRANRVYNAVYNDLAEGYVPEEAGIEPGDIVEVTNTGTVVKAKLHSRAVVGVVSDCYATCFGATSEEIARGEKIAVGLIGRVPIKIAGRAQIGDFVISIGNGIGTAMKSAIPGQIVGKVIQNKFTEDIDRVMCLIFPA